MKKTIYKIFLFLFFSVSGFYATQERSTATDSWDEARTNYEDAVSDLREAAQSHNRVEGQKAIAHWKQYENWHPEFNDSSDAFILYQAGEALWVLGENDLAEDVFARYIENPHASPSTLVMISKKLNGSNPDLERAALENYMRLVQEDESSIDPEELAWVALRLEAVGSWDLAREAWLKLTAYPRFRNQAQGALSRF